MKFLTILAVLFAVAVNAQKDQIPLVDQYMKLNAEINDFSGAVLIAKGDDILYQKAFGLASRELAAPNTTESIFRIGSVTKQFTAAAILQLVEAGKLSLDDKLSKFFPDFPKADSVTIHMLLTHTSGIKDFAAMPSFASVETLPYARDQVVNFFKKEPYDFSPGSGWKYCNSGYFLLGYIIEKVSGQPYSLYLANNVINRADLPHTFVDKTDSILANRAQGYSKGPGGWRHASYLSMEFPFAAGAMVSTLKDLHKWNKALHAGKIISPPLLAKMTTPFRNQYGYALRMDSIANNKRIGHGGAIPGFEAYDAYFPAEDLHLIVLSNNSSPSPEVARALAAILFKQKVAMPSRHKKIDLPVEELKKFTGEYHVPDYIYTISLRDGNLYFRRTGGIRGPARQGFVLHPESATKLFHADGSDRQINFEFNADNSVRKVELISAGYVEEMKKLKE